MTIHWSKLKSSLQLTIFLKNEKNNGIFLPQKLQFIGIGRYEKSILVIYRIGRFEKWDLSVYIGIGRYGKKLIGRTLFVTIIINYLSIYLNIIGKNLSLIQNLFQLKVETVVQQLLEQMEAISYI